MLGLAIGGVLAEQTVPQFLTTRRVQLTLSVPYEESLPALLGASTAWVVVASLILIGILLWIFPKPPTISENWPWYSTGLILAALGTAAWIAGAPTGWHWGLSMIGPSRPLLRVLLEQTASPMTWGAFMLLGIPLGSWLSASLKGTAQWQIPESSEYPRRFIGGFMMGVGGTLAAGCNIGNALTGLSILSLNSFLLRQLSSQVSHWPCAFRNPKL